MYDGALVLLHCTKIVNGIVTLCYAPCGLSFVWENCILSARLQFMVGGSYHHYCLCSCPTHYFNRAAWECFELSSRFCEFIHALARTWTIFKCILFGKICHDELSFHPLSYHLLKGYDNHCNSFSIGILTWTSNWMNYQKKID